MAAFLTPYRVEILAERRDGRERHRMLEDFAFQSEVAGRVITVPAGFEHDTESIALALRSFTGPLSSRAGAIHDHLYTSHELPREISDEVYREALLVDGVDEVYADQRRNAVRFYGADAWAAT